MKNKSIVIVVAFQNGYMNDSRIGKEKLISLKNRIIETGSLAGHLIATKYINNTKSNFYNILGYKKLMDKSSQAIDKDLMKYYKPTVIEHTGYGFDNDNYLKVIREMNGGRLPEVVFLCGLDSDACVLTIAHQLFSKGIRPVLVMDATYSSGGEVIDFMAKQVFKRCFGRESVIKSIENVFDLDNYREIFVEHKK